MEIKPDFKTVRSNYIFQKVNTYYKAKYETYGKWYLGGAINGILLNLEEDGMIEIGCYDSKDEVYLMEDSLFIECNDIYLLVNLYNFTSSEIEEIIYDANDEFNKLNLTSEDLDTIKKLQLSVIIQTKDDSEALKDRIISSVSALVQPIEFQTSELVSAYWGDDNYTFEVEFYLEDIKEEELAAKLKPYFNYIKAPLLKYGYIVINHTGIDCIEQELKWSHITGR